MVRKKVIGLDECSSIFVTLPSSEDETLQGGLRFVNGFMLGIQEVPESIYPLIS
jgi:hypothetical protein